MKNRKYIFFKMTSGVCKNANVHKYRKIVKAFRKYELLSKIHKWKIVGKRAIQVAKTTLLIQKRVSLTTKLSHPKN